MLLKTSAELNVVVESDEGLATAVRKLVKSGDIG